MIDNEINKEGGLVIALDEKIPTLIVVEGKIVKIYLLKLRSGKQRARFVSDRSVKIYGPNRVSKGFTDGVDVGFGNS